MDKLIMCIAAQLKVTKLRKVGQSWHWKNIRCGDDEQTYRWMLRCSVRRGVLPPWVLPPDDPIRQFTECNGSDPEYEII